MMNFIKYFNINNASKGFTLVELLLVVALIGVSVGVTTDILLSVTRNYSKTQVLNEIEQQANFVSLKLNKELRNATNITEPLVGDSSVSSLTFITRSGTEVNYYIDTGVLYRQTILGSTTSPAYPITASAGNEGISIVCPNDKCFNLIAQDPDILGISLLFQKANVSLLSNLNSNIKVEDTIVLRGTY